MSRSSSFIRRSTMRLIKIQIKLVTTAFHTMMKSAPTIWYPICWRPSIVFPSWMQYIKPGPYVLCGYIIRRRLGRAKKPERSPPKRPATACVWKAPKVSSTLWKKADLLCNIIMVYQDCLTLDFKTRIHLINERTFSLVWSIEQGVDYLHQG